MAKNEFNFILSVPQDFWEVLLVNQILNGLASVLIFLLLIYFAHGLYTESLDTSHPHDQMYYRMTRAATLALIFYLAGTIGSILRTSRIFNLFDQPVSTELCQAWYLLTWIGFGVARFINDLVLFGKFFMTFRDSAYGQRDQHPSRWCWCGFNVGFLLVLAATLAAYVFSIVFFSFAVIPFPVKNRPSVTWCSVDPKSRIFSLVIATGYSAFWFEVIIQSLLLVLYSRRFREISAKAGHYHTGKQDTLVRFLRRNFNLAFWTIVPSIFFAVFNAFLSPAVGTAIQIPVDSFMNCVCIVLIFRFSTAMYEKTCTSSENCLVGIKHTGQELGRVISTRSSSRALALSLSHEHNEHTNTHSALEMQTRSNELTNSRDPSSRQEFDSVGH